MRSRMTTVLLAACCLLLGATAVLWFDRADAEPPPPSFWDFTLQNPTGMEAAWIDVAVWHADAPEYESLPMAATLRTGLDSLGAGRSLTMATPTWYGAARIRVSAFHAGLYASAEIEASQGDYDGDGRMEYAGFCPVYPNGAKVFLGATILPPDAENPQYRLRLQGLSRWGTFFELKTDTVPFQ